MDKKKLSEADICLKFITPALVARGWDLHEQVFQEFTLKAGRMVVRGQRAARDKASIRRADYMLCHHADRPIAVIEAKDNHHSLNAGMAQAIEYAQLLDVPFAFSSNGDGFIFRDRTLADDVLEREITLDEFPSPSELWQRYCAWKGWSSEVRTVAESAWFPGKSARYYQITAVNRTVEAIATGRDRVLLVMATGTGKTFTAFQIIWRLWKSGARKRILYLADRNILIDQTMVNDFKPFKGAMAKLSPNQKGVERVDADTGKRFIEDLDLALNKTTKLVDKSYEIYLSLYQAVSGREDEANIYKQFSPDFFDLIVVDECHRGSAAEDSAWREILSYFKSAAQIGLTATPKETEEVSNSDYFGEPLYTYSLKQGIDDGYLAPYKVIRIDLDRDVLGWRPSAGMTDKHGNVVEDRIYNQSDMNRSLVLEARDQLVAEKITDYLKATDRYAKTIVFCEDIDHAGRMRQALSNANADICVDQPKYVVQITGDNREGKLELDNFIDPEKTFPVIATTSRLMSTGVDAQTCKLIVLDQTIKSMTTFKQIVGRGTRLREDLGKTWFTIMDFKRATEMFADKEFDGDPAQVYQPGPGEPVEPPEPPPPGGICEEPGHWSDEESPFEFTKGTGQGDGELPQTVKRFVIDGKRVPVSIAKERVQYLDAEGKLITESLRDYTRINVKKQYESLDAFLRVWSAAERKAVLIAELDDHGVFLDALADEVGKDFDPFDLVLHVAYDMPPLTRAERANQVRKRNVFTEYGPVARQVIAALIDKYADSGVQTIESMDVLRLPPIDHLGTPIELVRAFGGKPQFLQAVRSLEAELYRS
ncbi:EcoAI/FtnUII family type I restriction enzme subunit R [Dyella japonica]|uniref:Restriction endonuclease n=1 Tax=Dyella japonica DSM 16301 TaxID=1440762 RepID=A0A0G9GXN6_9GAMM|nr:DEAD/DEAH box helicase family protein [Dyella japonica]KLD62078.1 restriction endonuclease [Dyella japonica DSM 16301]